MTRKLSKLAIGVALVATALLGMASAAQAAQWNTNGPVNFTATAPASRFQINSSTPVAINCSATGLTGALKASQASGTGLMSIALGFGASVTAGGSCNIAGITYNISCTFSASLNASSYSGSTSGYWLGGFTVGYVVGISCTVSRAGSTCSISISGTVSTDFINATASHVAFFNFKPSGGTLTATWTNCASLFGVSNGSASVNFGSQATPPGAISFSIGTPSTLTSQPRAAFF